MGFDKNNPNEPIVHVERRATQVNIWVIIGVLVMILAAGIYMWHAHEHPVQTQNSAVQSLSQKP